MHTQKGEGKNGVPNSTGVHFTVECYPVEEIGIFLTTFRKLSVTKDSTYLEYVLSMV